MGVWRFGSLFTLSGWWKVVLSPASIFLCLPTSLVASFIPLFHVQSTFFPNNNLCHPCEDERLISLGGCKRIYSY